MPRYQDFFPRARHFVQFPGIPWSARGSKNRPFWYPDTKMARYHENILFTIQKLCFQGAKATKISIFWYPKTPTKQLSSRAGAKMGWGMVPSQQLSSQAGAKMPRHQPSWCQDIKISFAREAICSHWSRFPGLQGIQKSTILVPRYQNGQISRKHIIYYTKAMFSGCQSHQNIDILGPRIINKAAK